MSWGFKAFRYVLNEFVKKEGLNRNYYNMMRLYPNNDFYFLFNLQNWKHIQILLVLLELKVALAIVKYEF